MISCSTIRKQSIRTHYDLATPFYRFLWGPHIHHGLWEDAAASPAQAQLRLTERLAREARIAAGDRVLDVGCGMGGSSILLARRFGCRVTGLTLSPLQKLWATASAALQGVAKRACFRCADAEKVHLPDAGFDVVWNVECSEHLFDKPAFFRRVAGWLRPGGRLALCAWLAGDQPDGDAQVLAVCRGFLCPSLGTAGDYLDWFGAAGLSQGRFTDLTPQVMQTWDICLDRIRPSWFRFLRSFSGEHMTRFLDHFGALRDAYRSGAMRYGLFTAEKPAC